LGRSVDRRRIELDLRTRPGGRHLAVVVFGTLLLATAVGMITGSAYAVRYAAVVAPLFVLLVALGTRVFADARAFRGLVAFMVVLGLVAIVPNVFGERTTAPRVAQAIRAGAAPGDVVAYCPDQLGPSVSRLLPAGIDGEHLTFPRSTPPQVVDWVDYSKVVKAADPEEFAAMLLDRAGPTGTVWVVWSPGYHPFKDKCQGLLANLDLARRTNDRPVKLPTKNFEHPGLIRFPPQ
ncbi:MAG: hypothetical protein M3203_09180, partial [Actinomycetota bacterium]|nr:hypothetical protein [Actinomycetota bacterium]